MEMQFTPPAYVRGNKETRAKRVVIFIHGVFGNGVGTWTNNNGAYFPHLLTTDATFDGTDIWVHQFPSPTRGRTYNIDELADQLRRRLDSDNVISNHEEIVFLAHSMGGLIARAYLLKSHEIEPERVRMLYFFGTPSTGSQVANLARVFSNNPQLVDLRPMTTNEPGVLGVYQSLWKNSRLRTVPTYCAYERRSTHGLQVVERASATSLCTMRDDPIDADHIGIVKPADTNDESYIAFRGAYRKTFERRQSDDAPVAWNVANEDEPLLRVRNVTQTPYCETSCWSHGAVVAPGDVVRFAMYYRNASLITARDSRIRLRIPPVPIHLLPITATLTSSNVQPVFGQVMIMGLTPVLLVPTGAWRYGDDPDDTRPLLYPQAAADDTIHLGDVNAFTDSERLVIEFRCEPVPVIAVEASKHLAAIATLGQRTADASVNGDLHDLLSSSLAGRVETNELGQPTRWVSDVQDVQDDGGVVVELSHYNNTDAVLRDLRAKVRVVDDTETGLNLVVTLRTAAGFLREDLVRIRFRAGTTQRLIISDAYRMPRTFPQKMARLASIMKEGGAEEAPEATSDLSFPTTASGEFLLGDLPPQGAISAFIAAEMIPVTEQHTYVSRAAPVERTTLNDGAEHPFVQVSNDRNTTAWRPQVTAFQTGSALGVMFYFRNSGNSVARDVRLHLALHSSDTGLLARGAMTARNAATLAGEAAVTFIRPTAGIRLYYDRADFYRESPVIGRIIDATRIAEDGVLIGDLDPGEWGRLKITYVTAPAAGDASSADCATIAAVAGERIEFTIAADNTDGSPIRDVKLRVRFDYSPQDVRSTITLRADDKTLATRTWRAVTAGKRVRLRFRDAQIFTSAVGRHFDAREASESLISVGDIPAGGRLFVRLIYETPEANELNRCRGNCADCTADQPCNF